MNEPGFQESVMKALNSLTLAQQYKLLEFINSMTRTNRANKPKGVLNLAGVFDVVDTQEFNESLKDCEQIDKDEW